MAVILAALLAFGLSLPVDVAASGNAPPCAFTHRQKVRLRGAADNPNPFLWVTGPDRISGEHALEEYQAGQGSDDFIYFHTRLLERDTKGIVTAACPDKDPRIIGIRVISGIHRGAFGFVDVRDAAYPPR